MQFDWVNFLTAQGISYVTEGKNVASGNVNIRCPLCVDDPSEHMGLNSETGAWACWRNSEHRGGNPAKLVAVLKGCSLTEAKEIVGSETGSLVSDENFANHLYRALNGTFTNYNPKTYNLSALFHPVWTKTNEQVKPFHQYLRSRKFNDIRSLSYYYDLRYCIYGGAGWRLIFPFIAGESTYWGWTGRAIGNTQPRYLSYPNDEGVKYHLYNGYYADRGGDVLVIVEGPIDTIKVDWYGQDEGIRAVGLLTTSASKAQLSELYQICPKFSKVVVMLDRGAEAQAMKLVDQLSPFNPSFMQVPENREDPGDLYPEEVIPLFKHLL